MKTHLFWKFFKSLPMMTLVSFGVLSLQASKVQAQGLSLPSLVSINTSGTGSGNNNSDEAVLTPDGRFVVFDSFASDLTAVTDNNGEGDVFIRDLTTNTTTLVSVNSTGIASGNDLSGFQSVTPDGRFVAFASDATDLVPNDSNAHRDVFVRDLQAGTTTLVSINNAGTNGGNGDSRMPVISADGRFVAFESDASDLGPNDTNGTGDIYVRDLQAGTTSLASINLSGTDSGNGDSLRPAITPDGRFVGFYGSANDLVSNDSGTTFDVFLRDMQAGTTTMASVNNTGTGGGNAGSAYPALSSDGRFVAFLSDANDLGNLPISGNPQNVFVRDLQAGTTILVSVNSSGTTAGSLGSGDAGPPMMSPDGRFIAFDSFADDLVANDANSNKEDVFLRDLQAGTTTLVSVNGSGVSGNDNSSFPVLSADGRFVAFQSDANDLAPNDGNGTVDVFVRNLTAGVTTLVSRNSSGTGSGNNVSSSPVISADGSTIAFEADASDLVSNDTNGNTTDVFVTLQPGQVQFSAATYSVNENGGTATITVTRTGGTGGTVTVDFATSDGTAMSIQDYTSANGTLTFNPGVTSQTFTVPILNDTLDESDETVNLTLSNPTGGATLGTPGQAVLTIVEGGEVCDNGIDDDGDTLVDCNDPDCASNAVCTLEVSGSGCGMSGSESRGAPFIALLLIIPLGLLFLKRRFS